MNIYCRAFVVFLLAFTIPISVEAQRVFRSKVELKADFLLAWRKGRSTLPLITTAPAGIAPFIGNPETEIVFGGEKISEGPQGGVRVGMKTWISDQFALKIGGFWVNDEMKGRSISSNDQGVPSIGIPYFDIITHVETAVGVAFEDTFAGGAKASTLNKIWGADIAFQWQFQNCCDFHISALLGYQYYSIRDNVKLESEGRFLQLANVFSIDNRFFADNAFHGGLLGLAIDYTRCSWDFLLSASLGLGEMGSTVKIKGEGVITPPTGQFLGFVQDTNRGVYCRSCFTAIPQISAKLCYRISDCICASIGYQFIYFSDLYLSAKQIDRRLNPVMPSDFPVFLDRRSSFWLQGITIGAKVVF